MKKILAIVLCLSICVSLCACGKNKVDPNHLDCEPERAEQSNNEIVFDAPVIVAEDEYVRVELVKFYEEYYIWRDFGGAHGTPEKADRSMEGANLEKIVVFKFYNKCDHKVRLYMDDIYLGDDGASLYLLAAKVNPAAGKNITAPYLIRTGEKETLQSMEDLYSFEGEFLVKHEYEEGIEKNPYKLKFSIPAALDMN